MKETIKKYTDETGNQAYCDRLDSSATQEYVDWLEQKLVKFLDISNQRELLTDFAKTFRYQGEGFLDSQVKDVVNSYIKGN